MSAVLTAFRQLGLHPVFVGQMHLDGVGHHEVQLAKREVGRCHGSAGFELAAFPIIYARQKLGMP